MCSREWNTLEALQGARYLFFETLTLEQIRDGIAGLELFGKLGLLLKLPGKYKE